MKAITNPKTEHLEFFGSIGCLGCILMMPSVTGILYQEPLTLPSLYSLDAFKWYFAWFAFQLICFLVIPGEYKQGVILRDGSRLTYKLNAFKVLVATHVAVAGICYVKGIAPLVWVAQNAFKLAFTSFIFSAGLSVLLYAASFRSNNLMLSAVGNSGYTIHDFWMGRELNPRIGILDLKQFCELRPGIFLWVVLNYAYAAKQYLDHGYLSNSMIFVCIGQLVYAADSVWFEAAILTTMDITTDGFGLQARYLALHPTDISNAYLALLVALNIASYLTFRGSNSQKNDFRTNPDSPAVSHLKYIKTETGSRLLVSGWWGVSRHINYFGDWCMGLSWCLATGFSSVIPYFYVVYFATLLVHRAYRDDLKCRAKYKKDWEKYCEMVPWKIVPYVY